MDDLLVKVMVSINLPPLSLPVVRFEHALVAGGLKNSDPATVLVAKGCN
jgi:hypothetical protein